MAEEVKAPIIRRIYETTAFDPERGTYRAVVIRIEFPPGQFHDITVPKEEFPPGQFHDITVPKEEYDPEKVPEYVKEWLQKYGIWVGKEIKL